VPSLYLSSRCSTRCQAFNGAAGQAFNGAKPLSVRSQSKHVFDPCAFETMASHFPFILFQDSIYSFRFVQQCKYVYLTGREINPCVPQRGSQSVVPSFCTFHLTVLRWTCLFIYTRGLLSMPVPPWSRCKKVSRIEANFARGFPAVGSRMVSRMISASVWTWTGREHRAR